MSSQRSTCSVTCSSSAAAAGSVRRHHAEHHAVTGLQRLGQRVVVGGRQHREVDREAAGAGAAQQRQRRARARRSAPTARRRRSSIAVEDPAQRGRAPRADRRLRCRPKPDAVGTLPASTAASAGSSTWTTSRSHPAQPAAQVGARGSRSPSASAWASSRRAPRSLSTLSPRGFSTVAASVHGPADLDLERARDTPAACSSSRSRSWASRLRARRWSTPGASVSRQPAGCRSAPSSLTIARRAPGHGRGRAAAGELGQVGQVGQLAEHDPDRFGVRAASSPGMDPTPVATVTAVPCAAPTRSVALIVADPTTRVPS